jgi:hypothetical protein
VVVTARFTVIRANDFFGFGMMLVVHALRTFVAIASSATSSRVEFKAAAFLKTNEDLFIAPIAVKVLVATGLELMSICSRSGPTDLA